MSGGYSIILLIYRYLPIYIPFLTTALYVIYILLMVFGIVKAGKDEDPELPVVGNLAKKIFEKQINTGKEDTTTSANATPVNNQNTQDYNNQNTNM